MAASAAVSNTSGSLRNPNQTRVFYGGGVAAAMMRKWSLSTAPSGCHGAEFTAFAIEVSFLKNAWDYYEGAYLGNGRSFKLLAWDSISWRLLLALCQGTLFWISALEILNHVLTTMSHERISGRGLCVCSDGRVLFRFVSFLVSLFLDLLIPVSRVFMETL